MDRTKRISVEFQMHEDGRLDEIGIFVQSEDGTDLSAQDIIDAVAESLLYHYENFAMEPEGSEHYDA